jgi:hypothetical protein
MAWFGPFIKWLIAGTLVLPLRKGPAPGLNQGKLKGIQPTCFPRSPVSDYPTR